MNLKDSRTRKALLAFGATAAVVAGGLTFGATAANAVTLLSVSPAVTSITALDIGNNFTAGTDGTSCLTPTTADCYKSSTTDAASAALNKAAFGLNVLDNQAVGTLKLSLDSAPSTTAKLYFAQGTVASSIELPVVGSGAAGNWSMLNRTAVGTSNLSAALTTNDTGNAATDVATYIAADTPGTYTFSFQESVGTASSSLITLTVLDAVNSATTGNDWQPTVSLNQSSYDYMAPAAATVSLSALTTTDSRGSLSGVPYLASGVGALTGVRFGYSTGPTYVYAAGTAGASSSTAAVAAGILTAGTLTATPDFNSTGAAAAGTSTGWVAESTSATATVNTQATIGTATSVSVRATDDTAGVVASTATPTTVTTIKAGKPAATFTATVVPTAGQSVVGQKVYFTLTPSTGLTSSLTANGTLVMAGSATSASASYYSGTTNSSGVATIIVTSPDTTTAHVYDVDAEYNGTSATQNVASYLTATKAPVFTNATSSIAAATTGTVTVTGALRDQFGGDIAPSVYTASLTFTPSGGTAEVKTATISTTAPYTFSYPYTPAVAPTAGTTNVVSGTVDSTAINYQGTSNAYETITWAASGTPAAVTVGSPATGSTQSVAVLGSAPSSAAVAVSGSLAASGSVPLAYRNVVLSGSTGVYFSNTSGGSSTDPLVTSLTVATNSSGAFPAYAYFTKAGSPTITATSADVTSVTATSTMTVANPTSGGYGVTVNPVIGAPGEVLPVAGALTDAFGNAVYSTSATTVSLSNSNGALGSMATGVATDSSGVFSTSFTAYSGAGGTGTLTAAITTPTAANAGWATAGYTVPATGCTYNSTLGKCITTASLTINASANVTTVTGPASRVGAGAVALSGTAKASTAVEIYGKAAASSGAYGLVGVVIAGTDGHWASTQNISATTLFFAKTTVSTSAPITVTVTAAAVAHPVLRSTVSLRATALGSGRVRLAANGGPTGRGTLRFYRWTGRSWAALTAVRGNAAGDATVTVTSPRGTITFRATYIAPGRTAAGANARVRVR